MSSPILALAWEIWGRGRRSIYIVLGCIAVCALINLFLLNNGHFSEASRADFSSLFWLLMTLSFLFLLGIFNYTEFNSTKEWNGFPYRLFALPVPTWQLVVLPMGMAVLSTEIVYFAWIKLVWTQSRIPLPEWFAVVLGAYVCFYQMTIWCLAGLKITRIVVLCLGGMSGGAIACLPFFADKISSPWFSEDRLIAIVIALAFLTFIVAWGTINRQRCGGGQRTGGFKTTLYKLAAVLPQRRRDFASPAAAQFWFEWRRTGWVLPACTAFVIVAIIAPISWFNRDDAQYASYLFGRVLGVPLLLAFVIGKGFSKCEFWSTNLSMRPFMAVRPLSAYEFVVAKMKVAALSVAITAVIILAFLVLWLSFWANTKHLVSHLQVLRFYPHSWPVILALVIGSFMVLTWRCLVSGLWTGLSGNRIHFAGAAAMQVGCASLLLLSRAIWSDELDQRFERFPQLIISVTNGIGWCLAAMIVLRFWFAAFCWSKNGGCARGYLIVWLAATVCFFISFVICRPQFDTERLTHLLLLTALLIFPLTRIGFAPLSLAINRHR
jgi:hypothetical protein